MTIDAHSHPCQGDDMTRCFKATRPDGRDFHTGTIDYAAALASGELVTHPRPGADGAGGYLSVSVSAADCTSMSWPCRLFEVEPVDPWVPGSAMLPNKRACHSLRVVRELPAHEALGPQGVHVAALIDRAGRLTADDADRLAAAGAAAGAAAWGAAWGAAWVAAGGAARAAAWDAAWNASRAAARTAAWEDALGAARVGAWNAALGAVWGAAWDAAWDATRDAARALVVRDLVSADRYDTLTMPWRAAIGPIHPDDPDTTPQGTK